MNDTLNKLQQLSKLFDAGIITKEELEAEKAIDYINELRRQEREKERRAKEAYVVDQVMLPEGIGIFGLV